MDFGIMTWLVLNDTFDIKLCFVFDPSKLWVASEQQAETGAVTREQLCQSIFLSKTDLS